MEDARKQELLKMSPKPIHGILTNNEPTDPKVKERRDFVRKVLYYFKDTTCLEKEKRRLVSPKLLH